MRYGVVVSLANYFPTRRRTPMRGHSRPWRSGIRSAPRRWATARLVCRTGLLLGFIFVPLALMPGCGGDESQEAGKTPTTGTTTTTETSRASNDVSEPVIDG